MLHHNLTAPKNSTRAVVLGSGGFVGGACMRSLKASGVEAVGLSRSDVDLLAPEAPSVLRGRLLPEDTLVFISARAPCKNAAMLVENARMAETVCAAIKGFPLSHLVYVSSDAVYRDSDAPLSEESCAEPASPHGAMHIAREVLLRSEYQGPLGILRPTLIYGAADPHNGYGPNRFRRLAADGQPISLFGKGEERRDHVSVNDVAGLLTSMVIRRSSGVLNAVSGAVVSFGELAEFVAGQFSPRVSVNTTTRVGAMPHGGFRPFDASGIRRAFPDFRIMSWRDGVGAMCRDQAGLRKS